MKNIKFIDDAQLNDVSGGLTLEIVKAGKFIKAPDAAVPGASRAFTNVVLKGPGDIKNLNVHP